MLEAFRTPGRRTHDHGGREGGPRLGRSLGADGYNGVPESWPIGPA